MRKNDNLYRILDANINRLQEGLRVCEDTLRFIIGSYSLAVQFKNLRHRLNLTIKKLPLDRKTLIRQRNIEEDRGKRTIPLELKRTNYQDILYANIQRTKESTRVLEEFSKLLDKTIAKKFKDIRYKIYELEKKITLSI
ncbi:MAG: thiamine-phosphate pyrophosphorylase [Candidatus Omnitrophica bacterium]|nr:thiamine-phosphate pyrophosphorylase [Candidatus Omnitrophota bacterium]